MTKKQFDFICIGAGLSGSLAARQLQRSGMRGILLDKARGPGGRMSTRRMEVGGYRFKFDHGAQFFTVRDAEFKEIVSNWVKQGLVIPWHEEIPHQDYSTPKQSARFVSTAGMSALVKDLTQDLLCQFQTKITEIKQGTDAFEVVSETGDVFESSILVISAPIPQAKALIPFVDWNRLSEVDYRPCVSLLFGSRSEFRLPEPGCLWLGKESLIEWISDNQKKSISQQPSLTVHLNERASRDLIEHTNDQIMERVLPELAPFMNDDVVYKDVHRWRFSQPLNQPMNPPFELQSFASGRVLVVGDAFCGGRVEGAAVSALSGVKCVLRELKK
jgi:predicted NAD/FAD-dependent oxidoreductase